MSNIIIVEEHKQKYTREQLVMLCLEMRIELDKIKKILDDVCEKCEQDLLDESKQS